MGHDPFGFQFEKWQAVQQRNEEMRKRLHGLTIPVKTPEDKLKPDLGGGICWPSCVGKQCGDDGCGGSCGSCPQGYYCDPHNNKCVADCKALCETIECGPAGGVGECDCGECSGPQDTCNDGICLCQPDCEGKECGIDGCGGSCGECTGEQEACQDGVCVCEPECEGMDCGDPDGCGGLCQGPCPGIQDKCTNGKCVCIPDCKFKQCGPNGCGGTCEDLCSEGYECQGNVCICVPDCEGKECGDSGCWEPCGECPDDKKCIEGKCLAADCEGRECGVDGVGGSCGACEEGSHCGEDGICYYTDCPEIPTKNVCEGSVLKSCKGGQPNELDCSPPGLPPGSFQCGLNVSSGKNECILGPCVGIPAEGMCDGDNHIYCLNNHKEIMPCGAWEKVCGLIPDKGTYGCIDTE
jgi:hypothetical protein